MPTVILYRGKGFRQQAHALRWWLEVRSLIIALVVACAIGVTLAALLAAWLIGCEAGGSQPRPSQPAPPSYTVRNIPPVVQPAAAGMPAAPGSPAGSDIARIAASPMQIFPITTVGERTTLHVHTVRGVGGPVASGLTRYAAESRLRCRPWCRLRSLPQSCPVCAPEGHLSCVRGGYWCSSVCDISSSGW